MSFRSEIDRREALKVIGALVFSACAPRAEVTPQSPEKTAVSERDQIFNEAGVFTSLIFNNPNTPEKVFEGLSQGARDQAQRDPQDRAYWLEKINFVRNAVVNCGASVKEFKERQVPVLGENSRVVDAMLNKNCPLTYQGQKLTLDRFTIIFVKDGDSWKPFSLTF